MSKYISYRYRLRPEPAFEYVSSNVVDLVGYTPEEHYADPDLGRKIVHPDFAQAIERYFQQDGARSGPMHVCWIHKDGREIWVEQFNTVIRDGDGAPIAVEGVAARSDPPPGWETGRSRAPG